MPLVARIRRGLYKDSIVLMRVAEALTRLPGVREAALVMATPANREMLSAAGRLPAEADSATAEDLLVVVEADGDAVERSFAEADRLLTGDRGAARAAEPGGIARPRSVASALAQVPDASLVVISTPGAYAGAEALKALRRGRHVFLFSDHVPLEQEVFLKQVGSRKGLLVMGPDCGTAIIAGTPLGFANVVRRGRIGLVSASGTGLQQVTCLIHGLGEGVSHAIGTGSRDLSDAVGGLAMRQGIAALAADAQTEVIVLISKPPSPSVAALTLDAAMKTGKPVVALLLGADPATVRASGATAAVTLEDAARRAVSLADPHGRGEGRAASVLTTDPGAADAARAHRRVGQRFIRGLFSGGTLATEAQIVWQTHGLAAFSNAPLDRVHTLASVGASREHTALDMGSEEFTSGRPHPMIDYRPRLDRIQQESHDPDVAVILLDVVLGFGAHPDPAAALAPIVRDAAGRVAVVGSVCGTDEDPQHAATQERVLRDAGMLLAPSNAAASALAAIIAS